MCARFYSEPLVALLDWQAATQRSNLGSSVERRGHTKMSDNTREMLLKAALIVFGAIFFLVYPLGLIWPSGWGVKASITYR